MNQSVLIMATPEACMTYYKEVLEAFDREYQTWIIAFCPDINSFFATNKRYFFWESKEFFESERSAIEYFECHISDFVKIHNEIAKDIGGIKISSNVYLENTGKWYEGNGQRINTLTREEAILKHRELWNWIANETEREHRCVYKDENPEVRISNLICDCWLCEYAAQESEFEYKCDKCPVNWGKYETCWTPTYEGLFDLYERCFREEQWQYAAKIAREIATLPEKRE